MVRIEKDLKRTFFYRLVVDGDVKKPLSPEKTIDSSKIDSPAPIDIIPYNPLYRRQTSRSTARLPSRRISWSRDADRVREISPISENSFTLRNSKIISPSKSYSDPYLVEEQKYPLHTPSKLKAKKKKRKPKKLIQPINNHQVAPLWNSFNYSEPKELNHNYLSKPGKSRHRSVSKPRKVQSNAKEEKEIFIRQQQDLRYQKQKEEQKKKQKLLKSNVANIRKVKSENNLRIPQEPLMQITKKTKTKKKPTPPRWRHVGDRTTHVKSDKLSRPFVSDYYF